MNKENKGKIILDLSGDLRYHLSYDCEFWSHCSEYGCDEEGICRCSTIDVKLDAPNPYTAVSLAETFFQGGEGTEGNFGFALAVRFLKQLFADVGDYFDINVVSGYYGEELEGIYALPDTEVLLQKQCDVFNVMTNSERVKLVLEMEYGHLLPEVAQHDCWELVDVPVTEVQADKGVLDRTSRRIVEDYQFFTPWRDRKGRFWKRIKAWFPGIIAVPKETGGFRVIDGFHRFQAWTEKPYGLSEQKWKKLRVNKKIKTIIPCKKFV